MASGGSAAGQEKRGGQSRGREARLAGRWESIGHDGLAGAREGGWERSLVASDAKPTDRCGARQSQRAVSCILHSMQTHSQDASAHRFATRRITRSYGRQRRPCGLPQLTTLAS